MTTLHESGLFNFPSELHGLGMQIHFSFHDSLCFNYFCEILLFVPIRIQNYRKS